MSYDMSYSSMLAYSEQLLSRYEKCRRYPMPKEDCFQVMEDPCEANEGQNKKVAVNIYL